MLVTIISGCAWPGENCETAIEYSYQFAEEEAQLRAEVDRLKEEEQKALLAQMEQDVRRFLTDPGIANWDAIVDGRIRVRHLLGHRRRSRKNADGAVGSCLESRRDPFTRIARLAGRSRVAWLSSYPLRNTGAPARISAPRSPCRRCCWSAPSRRS